MELNSYEREALNYQRANIEIFGKNSFEILDALQKTKIKGKLQTVKKVSFRT